MCGLSGRSELRRPISHCELPPDAGIHMGCDRIATDGTKGCDTIATDGTNETKGCDTIATDETDRTKGAV